MTNQIDSYCEGWLTNFTFWLFMNDVQQEFYNLGFQFDSFLIIKLLYIFIFILFYFLSFSFIIKLSHFWILHLTIKWFYFFTVSFILLILPLSTYSLIWLSKFLIIISDSFILILWILSQIFVSPQTFDEIESILIYLTLLDILNHGFYIF